MAMLFAQDIRKRSALTKEFCKFVFERLIHGIHLSSRAKIGLANIIIFDQIAGIACKRHPAIFQHIAMIGD